MKFLKQGNAFNALRLLKKANLTLVAYPDLHNLLTITLNNLGCYYKSVKKPKLALKHFEDSICLQQETCKEPVGLAGTYLNISALHSDLGNHQLAANYTADAIEILAKSGIVTEKALITLAMAYNSSGVEQQFLKNQNEAVKYFEMALSTAKQVKTAGKLIQFMKNSLETAEKKAKFRENEGKSTNLSRRPQRNTVKSTHIPIDLQKLPQVARANAIRHKSTPSPTFIQKTSLRFLTGDRLTPMFSRTPMMHNNENKDINKTLENISEKINFLQTKLEKFHQNVEPLREIADKNDTFEQFSPKSLHFFAEHRRRIKAVKKIQKFFREYSKKL